MAADIGVEEELIVLPAGTAEEAAGPVLHSFGPRVRIAVRQPGAAQEPPPATVEDLDPVGALGLAAFQLRQSAEFAAAKAQRPYQGQAWDAAGMLPPDLPPALRAARSAVVLDVVGTTSERLTGRIAVGVIIVSGPDPDLKFSAAEQQKVVAEIQEGLTWLARQNPEAGISWNYDPHSVDIDVQPELGPNEALWRDPAMAKLGYRPGLDGVKDYVERIRARFGTTWTYVAYFTKYPLEWFAYADPGGPALVMNYKLANWGPDNIDRVFVHETCHVFQAPDEYEASNCHCDGSYGIYGRRNGNCIPCSHGVSCIMNRNDWSWCRYTPWHVGFPWPAGQHLSVGDTTSAPPAAVVFNNRLIAFWRASTTRIDQSGTADGVTWPESLPINGFDFTAAGPAVCVFEGRVYVFWPSADNRNRIFFSAGDDGRRWPRGIPINDVDTVKVAITACVFRGSIYLFWKGEDDIGIYFSRSADGKVWPQGVRINDVDTTDSSPPACVFRGQLYVFWKGADRSSRIYYSVSADGAVPWRNGRTINEADGTSTAPGACVLDDRLYLFWKSNESKHLYFSLSDDGAAWPDGQQINRTDESDLPPVAVVFQDQPYLFWQGASDELIYHSP